MNEPLKTHAPLWNQVIQQVKKDRLASALLFVAPRHAGLPLFVDHLIAFLICSTRCGTCHSCCMLKEGTYPDLDHVSPEKETDAIKIDQIRVLQQTIFQTPTLGKRRFIVINPADKMNIAAANALLKILEEPPPHSVFILIAESMQSLPATILSRCQKYSLPAGDMDIGEYVSLGKQYPENAKRRLLFEQKEAFVKLFVDLMAGKVSPSTIAVGWKDHALEDILWFLYLLTAEAIYSQLVLNPSAKESNDSLFLLAHEWRAFDLFEQLKQISAIIKKINHNLVMNQTLVLENLLLGFLSCKKGVEYG